MKRIFLLLSLFLSTQIFAEGLVQALSTKDSNTAQSKNPITYSETDGRRGLDINNVTDGESLSNLALLVIEDTYGDTVSARTKKKFLVKFGRNDAVGTGGATLMTLGSGQTDETYVNRNLITHVSSSSASDTGVLRVEGHTVGSDISVSSITQTLGTATATTATAHGLDVNDWTYIEGADQSGYNGIVKVLTVPSTGLFTYSVVSTTVSPATGTITSTEQNKTFIVQDVTMTGQTKAALTTPLARATRAYVPAQNKATNLVGAVYVFEDDTLTGGVPDTATKIHAIIPAGKNQTEKASTSLSSVDYWVVESFHAHMFEKSGAIFADVELQYREVGGVFRPVDDVAVSSNDNTASISFSPPAIIPKNADVRLRATASAAGTDVGGSIQGFLVKVAN